MIEYRPFRNTDSPAIVNIWQHQSRLAAILQPLTDSLLEMTVLSKTCFDPLGLILAWDGERPVGLAHAGFGPANGGMSMDRSIGATSMLLVVPHGQQHQIALELLAHSERYLTERGTTTLLGGSIGAIAPFYLGLYGGSGMPGILVDDHRSLEFFGSAGYVERERCQIWQCDLARFRPAIDRHQLQIRRNHGVQVLDNPPVRDWWEACHVGQSERTQYTATSTQRHLPVGTVVSWDMEPLASSLGIHARGVARLEVDSQQAYEPFATYLLGEVLRLMASEGVATVEMQILPGQSDLRNVLVRQGFIQTGEGVVLQR